MKLNPFNKKSTAYYDKVKAEYDKLDREMTAAREELQKAEADHERKQQRHNELSRRGSMYSSTADEAHASIAASTASHRVGAIKGEIGQLESRIRPLRRIALAPEQFAKAKKTLDDLIAEQTAINGELEKVKALIAKVGKRVTDAEARIATETQSARQQMLDADGEFVVPESLTKLEAELRLAKSSLAELEGKRDALVAKLQEFPGSIREAERVFIGCRADVVEIELYEQLMPVMNQFARASAARRQCDYRHDEDRFEIEIPHELVEAAQAALANEVLAT
jgi:predicted  nucleic acid-binding Zn-ribbon protein